jgi:hypothetical protein
MECDICYREHDAQKLPFLCAVDARNRIYELRMANLQSLMRNESLQQDITTRAFTKHSSQGNGGHASNKSTNTTTAAVPIGDVVSRTSLAADRTNEILARADALRNEIKAARDEARARRSALSRRRTELAAVSEGMEERREKQLMEVQKTVQTLNWRWKQTADEFAEVRSFLCAETASLYGLKANPLNHGTEGIQYQIGRVPITDLMDMNCESFNIYIHVSFLVMTPPTC